MAKFVKEGKMRGKIGGNKQDRKVQKTPLQKCPKNEVNLLKFILFTITVDNFSGKPRKKVGENAAQWEKMQYFYTLK